MGSIPDTLSNSALCLGLQGVERRRFSAFQPKLAEQDISQSSNSACSPTRQQGICCGTFPSHPLETNYSELSSGLSPSALNVSAVTCHRAQESDSRECPRDPQPVWPCTPLKSRLTPLIPLRLHLACLHHTWEEEKVQLRRKASQNEKL